jgi:hypothetical protein
MRIVLFAVLALFAATPAATAAASDAEPVIYIFWSASCPVSKAAMAHLHNVGSEDPDLRVRDFEVDHEADNMSLLRRVYEALGLPGLTLVPLIIVGPDVIIGYSDDQSAGQEILNLIAGCRRERCRDIMRDLIGPPATADAPSPQRRSR